jgi:NAD(P)-dependent dehydrogenase (short-subunit alcohol dehydrogenase family)
MSLTLIDVCPETTSDELVLHILQRERPREMVIRDGRGFAPSWTLLPRVATPAVRVSGLQVVSGGLGGVGRLLCRHLVERGAGSLLILGRRALDAEGEAFIRGLGVPCEYAAVDVADAAAVQHLITAMGEPVRGVHHLAGVAPDSALVNQSRESLREAMAPKLAGAIALDRATTGHDLEHFTLFSSVSAHIEAAGQASYAAANAALEAWADDLRRRSRPAVALAFGPWAATGLALNAGRRARRLGLEPMTPASALAALDEAWSSASSLLGCWQVAKQERRVSDTTTAGSAADRVAKLVERILGVTRPARDQPLSDAVAADRVVAAHAVEIVHPAGSRACRPRGTRLWRTVRRTQPAKLAIVSNGFRVIAGTRAPAAG